jgi:hypothetical protein
MDFVTILESLLIVAGLIEIFSEIIKTPYLKFKNTILLAYNKPQVKECTKYEKRIISTILSLAVCIVAKFGVDIPAWNESALLQYIIAGVFASLGSNILHMLLSIGIAFKELLEKVNQAKPKT